MTSSLEKLKTAAYTFPAIDNHAHPLLSAENQDGFSFDGVVSESGGDALLDSKFTLARFRATPQLAKLFGCLSSWEDISKARSALPYDELCGKAMSATGIQCLLLDDGLGGVSEHCESLSWHDKWTTSPTKRILRVEVFAEGILRDLFQTDAIHNPEECLSTFMTVLKTRLSAAAQDPNVVGFKSIACYRTGLDISTSLSINTDKALLVSLAASHQAFLGTGILRLAEKSLNDAIVCIALDVAAQFDKPVQFHTGLGDTDIRLTHANPAMMQHVIEAYPKTNFVLLHSSYPYTKEAGYLTAMYANVYLDFGEVFPFVSAAGQREIIHQVLHLSPTNKILWSTDGHWWPESFYLGTIQARETLFQVLSEYVKREEMSEQEAVDVVERALFHNANRIYNLGLQPIPTKLTTWP